MATVLGTRLGTYHMAHPPQGISLSDTPEEMFEIPALLGLIESGVVPVAAGWVASEVIGLSPKMKSNSVLQLAWRITKAVIRELADPEPEALTPPAPEPAKPARTARKRVAATTKTPRRTARRKVAK